MDEEIPGVTTSHLVTLAVTELHTWVESQDARLALTGAIAVAACAGRSLAAAAFADACMGFGGRSATIDEGGLGRPLILTPQHDAPNHSSHWPPETQPRQAKLVTAIVRSFVRCRCGIHRSDGSLAATTTSSTALCDSHCFSVPPVVAVRQCPATAAALAAITEAYERAGGSVRYDDNRGIGIVSLGLETWRPANTTAAIAAVEGACRIWGATTLRGLVVPSVPSAAVEAMLCACPHLTSLSAGASPLAAVLTRATTRAGAAATVIPHFGSVLHTLDLTVGPDSDAMLHAIVTGLPRLRALAVIDSYDTVTAAAWRRNLLALLERLEVLELRSMGDQMFTVLNSLADPEAQTVPVSPSPFCPSCLADWPVVPLRSLTLSTACDANGDATAFIDAVSRHQQNQLPFTGDARAGLSELRLSEVSPDTWLAAPPTLTVLCIDYPYMDEAQPAALFDGVRLPNLKCLTLPSCNSIFPRDVVYHRAPLGPTFARSPLRAATHPMLRTLRVECPDTYDSGRTARREAWMAAVLGASQGGSMDGTGGRFPRLRHVMFNGAPLSGWPDHDPFVPPSHPPRVLGFVRRVAAALDSLVRSPLAI